jgi:hypothetical protein
MTDSPLQRTILVISLSLNVFLLAAVVTYGSWFALADIDKLSRAVLSVFVFVLSFGAGTILFWKIVSWLSGAKSD